MKNKKSEKEKMLSGVLYDANNDPMLISERLRAQDLCFDYNHTRPSDQKKRKEILECLLGKTEDSFLIEQPFWCDYGYNIKLGENFYSNHNLVILDAGKVTFGNNVFIGPNCSFYTSFHPKDADLRNAGLEYASPIEVGDNVWFGGNVVVLPGVRIGDNAIIGAGSIVNKDIPSNTTAVGNPCRIVKTEKDITE